jgi:Family of unknown function (DUF6521)
VNLNPAFLALLVRQVATGYQEEGGRALPLPLAFVALPIVLHRPTRESLPRITTSLPVWLQEHQFLREGFAVGARAIAPAVREALTVALSSTLVRLVDGALEVGEEPRRPRRATAESRAIAARAHFVGRWLARAGDVATIYLLWGVKP